MVAKRACEPIAVEVAEEEPEDAHECGEFEQPIGLGGVAKRACESIGLGVVA